MSNDANQVFTHQYCDVGPTLQVFLNGSSTALGLAATIPESSNINSNVINCNGYKSFSFGVTSSQAGALSIQRYIDQAGTIAIGSAITGSISAATPLTVNNHDGVPFGSLQINITNTSGSTTANLTGVLLLLQSN